MRLIKTEKPAVNQRVSFLKSCGKTGIRTLGTRKGTTVFETVPIDHSGIFPRGDRLLRPMAALSLNVGQSYEVFLDLKIFRVIFCFEGLFSGLFRGVFGGKEGVGKGFLCVRGAFEGGEACRVGGLLLPLLVSWSAKHRIA